MDMEYRESKRGRYIIVAGVLLALVAAAGAFFVVNQAQQQGGQQVQKVSLITAARDIPARKQIEASDLTQREVPVDTSTAAALLDPNEVIGRVAAIDILQNQVITRNLLASSAAGGQFSILGPAETIAPDSPFWRAISISVPDDRAVGGLLTPGQRVDIFVTVQVNVPGEIADEGTFYTDKSTKVTYQDVPILARSGTLYVLRVDEKTAEEVNHLLAAGNAAFSLSLRPDGDGRQIDTTEYGETTNKLIERYGLPVPETYPEGKGAATPAPTATPTPSDTPAPSPTP
ncbi:MAG: Flp pilus assembly protein CpaB [Chloroflexi bacterium GWC2_73_18]|nr:MAG: Flp pilus assembly protein CpaB [Chloroflexi bacterium GWC2_73_18]